MRLLLTSDWHLGKNLFSVKLLKEQAKFFEDSFLPLLREVKPQLLIVAGDILDKPLPDQETLLFFEELLRQIYALGIPSLLILGNHDSKRTSIHKSFLELGKIFMVDDLRFFFEPFSLEDEKGERLNLYLLPYLPLFEFFEKVKERKSFIIREEVNHLSLLRHLFEGFIPKKPSLFISHFALKSGTFTGEEIQIRGFSSDYLFPEDLFTNFDLVFLGHLHRAQRLGEKFYYPGAPLPYSFETRNEKKGVFLFEFKEGTLVHSEFISLTPSYELLVLKGSFHELMNSKPVHSYVKILLEEEVPIYQAFERLKERFPNLLSLEYLKANENQEETSFIFEEEEALEFRLDPVSLFREFYFYSEGREIEEEFLRVYDKYLKEFYEKEEREGRLWQ